MSCLHLCSGTACALVITSLQMCTCMRSSVFVTFLLRKHFMKIVLAGADPERLYRLLRFATVHGVFNISRGSRRQRGPDTTAFANNALSACLREDHPNSQKHLVSAPNQSL